MATDCRPPATSARPLRMPLEALPPEIWHLAILLLDDHCYAWLVLRRVSPFLRQITEDVFAPLLVRDCSLRFTGQYTRSIVYVISPVSSQVMAVVASAHQNKQTNAPLDPPRSLQPCSIPVLIPSHSTEFANIHAGSDGIHYRGPWRPQFFNELPSPGFTFKVVRFSPDKTVAVLTLQELSEDHESRLYYIETEKNCFVQLTYPFALRQRCCACPSRIQSADDIAQCDCFRTMFFNQSSSHLNRMIKDSHFVRFDTKLHSLRIPSLSLDTVRQELSFDWRRFLHTLYHEELRARQRVRPWLRHVSLGDTPSQVKLYGPGGQDLIRSCFKRLEILEGCKKDGWIFWNEQRYEPWVAHDL